MKVTLALAILAMILWVGAFLALTPPLAAVIVTFAVIVTPTSERWLRSLPTRLSRPSHQSPTP